MALLLVVGLIGHLWMQVSHAPVAGVAGGQPLSAAPHDAHGSGDQTHHADGHVLHCTARPPHSGHEVRDTSQHLVIAPAAPHCLLAGGAVELVRPPWDARAAPVRAPAGGAVLLL